MRNQIPMAGNRLQPPLTRIASTGAFSLLIAALLASPEAVGQREVLGLYVGKWDIHATTLQPQRSEMTYQEEYRWTLGGKYIVGETTRKPDGSHDVIYGTWDANAGGYPFWIFSSTGSYTYVPPGKWDARRKLMTWSSPREWDVSFNSRCDFTNSDHRKCSMIMKDWKGKVLLELQWRAVRRPD